MVQFPGNVNQLVRTVATMYVFGGPSHRTFNGKVRNMKINEIIQPVASRYMYDTSYTSVGFRSQIYKEMYCVDKPSIFDAIRG